MASPDLCVEVEADFFCDTSSLWPHSKLRDDGAEYGSDVRHLVFRGRWLGGAVEESDTIVSAP